MNLLIPCKLPTEISKSGSLLFFITFEVEFFSGNVLKYIIMVITTFLRNFSSTETIFVLPSDLIHIMRRLYDWRRCFLVYFYWPNFHPLLTEGRVCYE